MTPLPPVFRRDLEFVRQQNGEQVVYVAEEPGSARIIRIGEVEHFIAQQFDGETPVASLHQRVEERLGTSLAPEILQRFIDELRDERLLEEDSSSTFDLDRFIGRCRDAVAQPAPADTVLALMQEAMSNVAGVRRALRAKLEGPFSNDVLFQAPDLLVLSTVVDPGVVTPPHDHTTWAVIGILGGQEDNTFYRESTAGLQEISRKELRTGNSISLDPEVIHAIANPLAVPTIALHVYGADILSMRRSMWNPHTLEACDFDPMLFSNWCTELQQIDDKRGSGAPGNDPPWAAT